MTVPTLDKSLPKKTPHAYKEGGLRLTQQLQKQSDTDRPLISIITIVFNAEKDIEQTIKNVLNQSYQPLEYIIIDGKSTDGTVDIIQKYEEKIDYWISESDEGTSEAMNKGIALAKGDLIGLINAGDWYSDDAISLVANEYTQHKNAVLHGKLQYWDLNQNPYYIFSARDDSPSRIRINHPTAFIPKSIYQEVGLFNLDFKSANDYEWYLRAKTRGVEFHYVDTVIANLRLGGMSDRYWLLNYWEITRARILHGQGLVKCVVLYVVMVGVTLTRKGLESLGLNFIVGLYRKYLASVKKELAK